VEVKVGYLMVISQGRPPKSSLNDLHTELFGIKTLMAKYEPLELGSI
jgi:hypothetical protein